MTTNNMINRNKLIVILKRTINSIDAEIEDAKNSLEYCLQQDIFSDIGRYTSEIDRLVIERGVNSELLSEIERGRI